MSDSLQLPFDPEEVELPPSPLNFPVVGMGASAGGLDALTRFFERMPPANGMAFVVILHLSPTHESSAAEILQRVTRMPVVQVAAGMAIEADHVYVIPPNHDLTMNDGHLYLAEPTRPSGKHVAIDLFFRTLGQVHRQRAIAIVLSGSGSDGAVGLARVKECGGITLAQSPGDADHDSMPRAAIVTGMVDIVSSVVDMPRRLVELWANARRIRLPADAAALMRVIAEENAEAAMLAEQALRDIMALLRRHSKNDFKHYKRATVLRRIERRLQVNALTDLPSYRDFLRNNAEEAVPLLQDMLISVTNFFRDASAFEALERTALPELVKGRQAADDLRVWVAGCATGEEAYTVAMLLSEQLDLSGAACDMQVFATDIDERAIGVGRSARYPESIMADVSPARVRQFFHQGNDGLRLVKKIREKVLFARHNILRDPPFSRLDLICCRNLLIYLDREAQARVLEMFRFALKPGGYLFLGVSEAADAAPNLFTVVDKKNRIYRVNPLAPVARRIPFPMDLPRQRISAVEKSAEKSGFPPPDAAGLHRRFVDEVTPPSVLVDARHEVLHLSENAGAFLLAGGGEPSRNLLNNIPPELRAELRTALFQVAQTGEPVVTRPVVVRRKVGQANVQLTLRYFDDPAHTGGLTLVMFEEVAGQAETAVPETGEPSRRRLVSELVRQIRHLKDQVHKTVAQAETSTEDVKASNEELQAMNEELRSASEELETSKEELQSINEEMTTINYELKVKVDETSKVNDDLQNLITSTDIATVFVDRSLRIKRFTPRAHSIFNLIASDINRSLLDITHRLDYASLADDAALMLKSSRLVERSVSSGDGRHYLARMCPYRSADNRINGAVLTFVDVTALREAEEKVRSGEEALRVAAQTTDDYAILTISEDGAITSWNAGATRMFGYVEAEIIGQPFAALFIADEGAAGGEEELRLARESGRSAAERWHRRKDGTHFYCGGVVTRLDGKVPGYAMITRDITDSKTLATTREELLAREKEAGEVKDRFLAVLSHELKHPLNLIQVNAELLVSQPEVRALPMVARTGEAIRRAVASQTKIIDDLLDLSRARTGKMMLKPQTEDLGEIVSSIVMASREAASAKGVRLSYECVGEAVLAMCDRVRTEQIVWNLINNAVKFTPAGGDVMVALSREIGFAKFTVLDSGKGISADFLPRIFGLFVQENDPTSRENVGLGVGLALVRDLAVAQGGRVQAESPGSNMGSRFSVWLPLIGQTTGEAEKPPPSSFSLSDMRILAVDDMPELLEPFALLLRIEGATVDTAVGGHEGLRMLDAQSYDLLISDIGMDDMDGYELIRTIRKNHKLSGLRAIALSGYGRQVDVNRALRSGFDAHLAKPATVAHICQTIAQLAVKNPV